MCTAWSARCPRVSHQCVLPVPPAAQGLVNRDQGVAPPLIRHLSCLQPFGMQFRISCCLTIHAFFHSPLPLLPLLPHSGHQGVRLRIHNSSVLFRSRPSCVVFTSVQQTDDGWFEMQGVTAALPEWLTEVAPHMYGRR